ncbi:MAG: hypothetical protein K5863_00085 [Nitratireductor sp.]|uniref:hypothetical protein n=1 Tax=Nitratireductor sp. TaxID=1872084 RepID=UPI00262776E5|nr:hypothetical protein [Nitratireductor sp.]MCV0348446.1 hypothetical protein [Nitratireductor sp.]
MAGNLYEQGYYETGTASITQGQTVVTGQGTAWSQIVRPADDFGKHVGRPIPIASVDSDTQITLAFPWPGPTQVAAPYRVTFTPYHVVYRQMLQQIMQLLSSGNVSALAGLDGEANKLPFLTGPGTMGLTGLTAFMRTLLDDADGPSAYQTLGTVPAEQVPADLPSDKAYRRGNVLGVVSQQGGEPLGPLMQAGENPNGIFFRFANGFQLCWLAPVTFTAVNTSAATYLWTFPAPFVGTKPVVRGCLRGGGGSEYDGISATTVSAPYSSAASAGIGSYCTIGYFSNPAGQFTVGGTISSAMVWAFGSWV